MIQPYLTIAPSENRGGKLLPLRSVDRRPGGDRVKKQKTDRKDAQLLRKLMMEDRFPRTWVPSPENRDLRQLLWHRHRLVQMRTRIMNQLQALAMNEGYRWKKKLFSEQGRGATSGCVGRDQEKRKRGL